MRKKNICAVPDCGAFCFGLGFCNKHYLRFKKYGDPLAGHRRARGSGGYNSLGYHVSMDKGRQRLTHILIAERVLGKPLPAGAVVHHANCDPSDNRNENLVICPDQRYHLLIHRRTRAFEATGDANKHKCCHCGEYDDAANMHEHNGYDKDGECPITIFWHKTCRNAYNRAYYEKRKARLSCGSPA
mgnify:FL=1